MLFNKIYNWLKYKTIPTSVLFRNRLFLERDSKKKRIFTNFGLLFRNSKWTNYEKFNIKTNFKSSFFKIVLLILILILFLFFLFYFNNYYHYFYYFNFISYFVWVCVDSFDYYFSFLIWIITILNSFFINIIYSYFFFNNFSNNNKIQQNTSKTNLTYLNHKYLNKNDLNWYVYIWLNKNTNEEMIEKIFDREIFKNWWNKFYFFFIDLYKILYLLNLSNNTNSIFNLNLLIETDNNFYLSTKNFSNSLSNLYFFYLFKNIKNYLYLNFNFSFFLKKRFEWNILNLINHSNNFFFFNNLTFNSFNVLVLKHKELSNLINNFSNQFEIIKINRWLYRFSILHRKIFKNSHKLTITKKLINFNIFNENIFNKNIWLTDLLIKNDSNNSFLNSVYNLYYNKDNLINLHLLNYYENSFLFIIKRFFFFNNFNINKFDPTFFSMNKFSPVSPSNSYFSLNNLTNYLLNFKITSAITLNQVKNIKFLNLTNNLPFYFKDLFLFKKNIEIFNKSNLNLIYYFTTNTKNQSLLFYNYNSYYLNFFRVDDRSNKFFKNKKKSHDDLARHLILSLNTNNLFFLNDFLFFIFKI